MDRRRITTLLAGPKSLKPVLGVMLDPPTATFRGTGTTIISPSTSIATNNAAIRYFNATGAHASGYTQSSPTASMAFIHEFITNAPVIDVRLLRYSSLFNIFVDEQPIQTATMTTDGAGTADLLTLDFTGTANPTASRRFRFSGINILHHGYYIPTGYSLTLPPPRKIAAIIGDSYTQGTGANGVGQSWARYCFEALGYDFLPEGVGGAGYTSATTPASRITDRLGNMPVAPAVVVLAMGLNNAGGDQVAIAASHADCVAASRAIWPSVPVVTMGPWTPLGSTPNLVAVKDTLMTSAAANSSRFIDVENIINATNKTLYTGGDNTHPNVAGHQFLGAQSALRFRAARIYA